MALVCIVSYHDVRLKKSLIYHGTRLFAALQALPAGRNLAIAHEGGKE